MSADVVGTTSSECLLVSCFGLVAASNLRIVVADRGTLLPHAELAMYTVCCDASNQVPTKCSDVTRHLPPEITLADTLIMVRVGVRVSC